MQAVLRAFLLCFTPMMAWPTFGMSSEKVFELASKSVVIIHADSSQGSGVFLTPALIATNCHVVGDAKSVVVQFRSSRTTASVVGRNDKNDVCIVGNLQNTLPGFQPVVGVRRFGTLRVGEAAFAIGAPIGFEYSITSGIISQKRRRDNGDIVQFDAAISPGNSGGGLFDADAKLIGLPSFHITSDRAQNLNFAWSVDVFPAPAKDAVERISAQRILPDSGASTPPVANGVVSSAESGEWQQAFDAKSFSAALKIADAWIAKRQNSADAYVARGRSKDAMRAGSGTDDFKYAIALNGGHQSAIYFAAKSARANGDPGDFQKYRAMLFRLNPSKANSL